MCIAADPIREGADVKLALTVTEDEFGDFDIKGDYSIDGNAGNFNGYSLDGSPESIARDTRYWTGIPEDSQVVRDAVEAALAGKETVAA